MKSTVHCKLPKAGLGNQLFTLMKAVVFAHLNKLPLLVTHYHQLKIGPHLRREKIKRKYNGYFVFQKSIAGEFLDKLKLKFFKESATVKEPRVELLKKISNNCLYLFSEMPHWEHYFDGLKENRKLVIELFRKLLSAEVLNSLKNKKTPCIGVHIRMGDFRKLKAGEDFSQVGAVRTPENYFIKMIQGIRIIHGADLPVSVFTDGYRNEFDQLFYLKNIELIEGNSDITDLLLLSSSQLIVTSAGSTFSYWAGFLSGAPIIMHPDHIHTTIRGNDLFEGVFDADNPLLVQKIKAINN